jgi:hypothetical protein
MRCLLLVAAGMSLATSLRAEESPVRHPNMGVGTHFGLRSFRWDLDRLMPMISDLGVGWVRDELSWEYVEPEKGKYVVPEFASRWINAVSASGIKIVLVLNNGNKLYTDNYDPAAYAAAAAFLARELKGKVHAIEVLNEPANFGYSKFYGGTWNGVEGDGKVSPWVGRYVTLINRTAKAVKAVNPSMKVIGLGSVAPVNFRQIAMGLAPEVDGITDHPYSFRLVAEFIPFAATPSMIKRDGIATADERGTFASQIEMYREVSAKHKGPKEIWLTEWGFPTHIEKEAKQYTGYTKDAQAQYALRRFAQCLGLGVDVSIWYDFWEDGSDPYNAEHRFGLVDRDYQPKPVYTAIRRLARFMRPYQRDAKTEVEIFVNNNRSDQWPITWDGAKIETTGTVMRYTFKNAAGDLMLLVWSSERAGGDLQPRIADIEIAVEGLGPQVIRHDLWTGEDTLIAGEAKPGRLMLKTVQVPAYPVAFIFKTSR